MLGLETALPVVATVMVETGRMTWADVARVMSTAPARIAGLDGQGGPARRRAAGQPHPGRPGTPLVVDRAESVSLSRNNPWHGRTLSASVHATFLRGVPTVLEGKPC